MKDACMINQQDGFVSINRVSHQQALSILRAEGSAYNDHRSLGSICEWSEAVATDNGQLVGIVLRDAYNQRSQLILDDLKGVNVRSTGELVCILEKQVQDWEDGVGPYLPAYGVQRDDTGQVMILILEYYLD
jgi:hypothetical protein